MFQYRSCRQDNVEVMDIFHAFLKGLITRREAFAVGRLDFQCDLCLAERKVYHEFQNT